MRTYTDSDADRRKLAAQTLDHILDAETVERHHIDVSWLLDVLDAWCCSLFRSIPKLAHGAVNLATCVAVLAAVLIYGPALVGAQPLYLVDQTEMWSVDESPVYIEGESYGANDGFAKILTAYKYRIVQHKEEARFIVTVQVALERPKTCSGYHRGNVVLQIKDVFTSKNFKVDSAMFTEKVSCKKDEYESELNAALRVAVHRQYQVLYAPFKPDDDGML